MSTYTTNASDFSKRQVTKAWMTGILGTLGFHYFKVGKIKVGIIRLLIGLFLWGVIISCFIENITENIPVIITMLVLLAIISLADFFRIKLGRFRDNVGAYVREP